MAPAVLFNSKDINSIFAALGPTGDSIPFEGHNVAADNASAKRSLLSSSRASVCLRWVTSMLAPTTRARPVAVVGYQAA